MKRIIPMAACAVLVLSACGGEEGDAREGRSSPAPETQRPGSTPVAAPSYTLPEGWIRETPGSTMRVEQFRLPGEGSGDAELAVFHFPGTGGTVQANIDRWLGQFSRPDGSPIREHAELDTLHTDGRSVVIVDVSGTYDPGMMGGGSGPLTDHRLLGAITTEPDGPWFYKLVGPRPAVERWESSFYDFVRSLRSSR
ncbi:MAG: hypothetical protein R6W82_03650 [bacterium]